MNAQRQRTASPTSTVVPLLQRKCGCGGACDDCSKKKDLQRSATSTQAPARSAHVHDALRSPGQPLEPSTRAFFENRFEHDFSSVRVHTDARSTRELHANAFTVGHDIVFGGGGFSRPLLAHELTHVMQQEHLGGGVQRSSEDEEPLQTGPDQMEEDLAIDEEEEYEADAQEEEEDLANEMNLLGAPKSPKKKTKTKKKKAAPKKPKKPKKPPNPCKETILNEGTCEFLAAHTPSCCDPTNGFSVPGKKKNSAGEECPDEKWTPRFACDNDCDTALAKQCTSGEHFMAVPNSVKSRRKFCNQTFTICANGMSTTAVARDMADKKTNPSHFEVSTPVVTALGNPAPVAGGGSFKGKVFFPGTAQTKIDADPCCKKPAATGAAK